MPAAISALVALPSSRSEQSDFCRRCSSETKKELPEHNKKDNQEKYTDGNSLVFLHFSRTTKPYFRQQIIKSVFLSRSFNRLAPLRNGADLQLSLHF